MRNVIYSLAAASLFAAIIILSVFRDETAIPAAVGLALTVALLLWHGRQPRRDDPD